jgi:adenine-specific DNA-methyltransferase
MPRRSRAAATAATTRIDSLRHQDERANIPPQELRDFVAGDEAAPRTLLPW